MRVFLAVLLGASAWVCSLDNVSAEISDVVVFGDSLSDVGNAYWLSGGMYPVYGDMTNGRFTNGRTWLQQFSERLGVDEPMHCYGLDGGTNFAYGGAETGPGWSYRDTPNLGNQITRYFNRPGAPSPNTLFVVSGGANDIFDALEQGENPLSRAAQAVDNLDAHVRMLAEAGAQQFLVPNLPALGSTPFGRQISGLVELNPICEVFNGQLAVKLDDIRLDHPSITINEAGKFDADVYAQMARVIDDPEAFGFDNVSDPAIEAIAQDPNADISGYFFWDGVHPTAPAHSYLGENMVVPEPSSVVLILIAFVAILLAPRGKLGMRNLRKN